MLSYISLKVYTNFGTLPMDLLFLLTHKFVTLRQKVQNLNNIPNPITDPARHQRIIHGVQMDPINITDQQINDLAQCIGHTG